MSTTDNLVNFNPTLNLQIIIEIFQTSCNIFLLLGPFLAYSALESLHVWECPGLGSGQASALILESIESPQSHLTPHPWTPPLPFNQIYQYIWRWATHNTTKYLLKLNKPHKVKLKSQLKLNLNLQQKKKKKKFFGVKPKETSSDTHQTQYKLTLMISLSSQTKY